jgi:general secretion pathway protein E
LAWFASADVSIRRGENVTQAAQVSDPTDALARAPLGAQLIDQGLLSARDLERALAAQREMGGYIGEVLIRLGLVAEVDMYKALAEHLGVAWVKEEQFPQEPLEIDPLPLAFLLNNAVAPVAIKEGVITVASAEPQSEFVHKALTLGCGRSVEMALALPQDVETALKVYFPEQEAEAYDDDSPYVNDAEFVEHLKDLASETPVIQLVNQLIQRSMDLGASDIHLESVDGGLRIRYRVDGVLQDASAQVERSSAAVISRVKLLASLNIAERRLPQDGRIMMRVKGHELDLRVSSLPTVHGECVVMRVLDRQSVRLDVKDMGFSPEILKHYMKLLSRPHGVLLLTGPTGSGKTTTLYASLSNLDSDSLKIITVEDPVEYQLEGINQIPVQAQIDLTFARALRSILRQDPDIIMIGEMRDRETAQIAVQASLTGHLVLSTLHTNTAAGAITRLEDMGVERFLITAAVNGVLAQRLVRVLCSHCKRPAEWGVEHLERQGMSADEAKSATVFDAVGCEHCKGTGFSGRTAIHELFVLDADIQQAILNGLDSNQLRELARSRGMKTLFEDGLRKVSAGITSIDEVLRVTQDQLSVDSEQSL